MSADKEESGFTEYCTHMPWLAVPWAAPQRLATPQRFQVNGIPHLKVLRAHDKASLAAT